MKKPNLKHLVRRAHRWLGVLIGVQFLLWTLGGVYFSWTRIAEIRGDDRLRRSTTSAAAAAPNLGGATVTPRAALGAFAERSGGKPAVSIRFVEALGESFYEIAYNEGGGGAHEEEEHHGRRLALVSASTGSIRAPFDEREARTIASAALTGADEIVSTAYLTADDVGAHHEYREKPLPAWALTLADGSTVYVAADNGQVQNIRGTGWRAYDFLWMLHTMGYADRDDFNNYVLRIFSLLGLATVGTGFLLFAVSSKTLRRLVAGFGGRGGGAQGGPPPTAPAAAAAVIGEQDDS